MNPELILCSCRSSEHQIILMDDSDEHYKQCYLLIHLNKRSFFDRLMYAIDYILGRQSKYGAFDEVVLDEEGMNQIINYLEKIKKQ